MIKAIILDFYGVLFSNFDWDVIDERIKLYPERAQKFLEYKDLSNQGEITNKQLQAFVSELAQDRLHPKAPAVYHQPFFNHELVEYLQGLSPSIRFGLLSNGNDRDVRQQLDIHGVTGMFSSIMTSSDTRLPKPSQEAFRAMLDSLNVSEDQAIFVDDSQRYITALLSYGMKGIHYIDQSSFESALSSYMSK